MGQTWRCLDSGCPTYLLRWRFMLKVIHPHKPICMKLERKFSCKFTSISDLWFKDRFLPLKLFFPLSTILVIFLRQPVIYGLPHIERLRQKLYYLTTNYQQPLPFQLGYWVVGGWNVQQIKINGDREMGILIEIQITRWFICFFLYFNWIYLK